VFVIPLGESAFRPWTARVTLRPLSVAWAKLRGLFGTSPRKSAALAAPPRYLRQVAVPDSLDDLKGPGSGVVELPITLFWSRPDRKFNLDDRYQAIDMYLAVLDRGNVDELAAYLNGKLLVELWPDLHLTRAKRLPWQARFAELRPAAVAA
jgi:hypothetical protein